MTTIAPTRHRRNAIVLHEAAVSHFLLGRVVRRMDENSVEVLDTLGRTSIVADESLSATTASAAEAHVSRERTGRSALVRRMPSLRRLKQNAAWYHPEVWRRDRRSRARRDFDNSTGDPS